jgi:hypothetical protein
LDEAIEVVVIAVRLGARIFVAQVLGENIQALDAQTAVAHHIPADLPGPMKSPPGADPSEGFDHRVSTDKRIVSIVFRGQ